MAKSFWDWFQKFDYLDTDGMDMGSSSTYIHHKINTIFRLPFAPTVCFIPWLGGIKNPLHNIFGHCTCQYWKEKNKAHLFLPLDERSSATCWFVSESRKEKWKKCDCSKSCHFLVWKKEFPGFLCAEKGLSIVLFTSSNLQLYD